MKKLSKIIAGYSLFCLVVCLAYGYFGQKIPVILPKYEQMYRLFNGIRLFCKAAPAVLFTGFVVGCAVSFGRNPEGSTLRFSSAMFKRYRSVLVTGLVCVFVLTAASEAAFPLLGAQQRQMAQMPAMLNDYVRIGNDLCGRNQLQLARRYAQFALDIDPSSTAADQLMQRIALAEDSNHSNILAEKNKSEAVKQNEADSSKTAFEFLKKSEAAAEDNDWFGAHYYAEEGLAVASEKDVNRDALKQMAADAWNRLAAPRNDNATEEQTVFEQKMKGYTALMDGDNLRAYYLFHTLSEESPSLSIDRDVVRYLAVAEERLNNECFFIDEKSFIKGFENASKVHFALKRVNGTDVVCINGVTTVTDSGKTVQYLRGFSDVHLDKNGDYVYGVYVAYAKVLETDTTAFDTELKQNWGVPDGTKSVPYILLRSVDRNEPGNEMRPVYTYADSKEISGPDRIVLPVSFEDFLLLEDAAAGAEYMKINSLYHFADKAKIYGYSDEVFMQVLINRLLYPLYMLVIMVALAWFAWGARIDEHAIFKFKWVLSFPVFTLLFYFMYRLALWLFTIQNYTILGIVGKQMAFACSAAWYIILLIIVSLIFVSRNDTAADEK